MTDSNAGDVGSTYKVERVAARYGLDDAGEWLERSWTGTDGEARSLRELADEFNVAVLRAVLEEAGEHPIEGESENMYRVLVDDDASSGDRTQVVRSLERADIDREQLERDFVTHQAVHTYLKKGRGVEKQTDDADPIERVRDTIQRLQSRVRAVTETSVSQLRDRGVLSIGEFTVLVSVNVACKDCGAHMSVLELLEAGGCQCDAAD